MYELLNSYDSKITLLTEERKLIQGDEDFKIMWK